MSFDIEGAKKAGYSDNEIQSFLNKSPKDSSSKGFDVEGAKSAGYSDEEIQGFLGKKDVSKTRSVLSAPVKGVIKGAEELSQFHDPVQAALNQLLPQKESQLSQLLEQNLPTKNEAAENLLERIGKLAPASAIGGAGILGSLLQASSGGVLGQLAKEEGAGETGQGIAELVGMGIPGLAKAVGKKAASIIKAPVEKLTSGLTKPRAVEAKFPRKGIISPERQQESISKLNQEASSLTRKTIEKELPLVKQIDEGIDFESQFEKRFGQLQKAAEEANPEINISPLSKFLSETSKTFRGIPKLHPEGEKISKEISAFGKRPQSDLSKLLRIYRSNNKKIKGIYETSRITGKQQEYVDFLVDYNRNISKSFEQTLPKDSAWVKEFKDTNQIYKQYRDTQKTLHLLEPVLGQKATPSLIAKLSDDPKTIKKLELAMGKQGASEISQISKDLRTASEAIKKIPAKELKAWDQIMPLSILLPKGSIPGLYFSTKKVLDWGRRGYGLFLSSPSRRKAYGNALKAISENNKSLYVKSVEELEKSIKEKSED